MFSLPLFQLLGVRQLKKKKAGGEGAKGKKIKVFTILKSPSSILSSSTYWLLAEVCPKFSRDFRLSTQQWHMLSLCETRWDEKLGKKNTFFCSWVALLVYISSSRNSQVGRNLGGA